MTASHDIFVPVARSEEQSMLADAVTRLSETMPIGTDVPASRVWGQLVELGLHTIVLDPDDGLGGAEELTLVASALGAQLNADAFIWSAVVAPSLLRAVEGAASDRVRRRLRDGGLVTVAMHGPNAHLDEIGRAVAITSSPDGARATGRTWFVPFARDADLVLLVGTGPDGLLLAELRPDTVTLDEAEPFDLRTPLASIALDGAHVEVLGPIAADLAALLAPAVLCQAAAIAGSAERALRDAVQYATVREQFGVPIAEFQAVRHRLAEMLVDVELMRGGLRRASIDGGPVDFLWAAYHCMATAPGVARANIQLHGGIGYTWEHTAHRHYRHAYAAREAIMSLGSLERHLFDRLVEAVDDADGVEAA